MRLRREERLKKKKKKKTIDKLWVNMQRRKKKRWGKICEEILERLEILYI